MKLPTISTRVLILSVAVALLLATSGSITVYDRTQISNTPGSSGRFEPTSAAGNTWATAWNELSSDNCYVSTWNNNAWDTPTLLNLPGSPVPRPFVDVFLSWDSFRQRFVVALLEPPSLANLTGAFNLFYGYSNGSSWTIVPTPALAST